MWPWKVLVSLYLTIKSLVCVISTRLTKGFVIDSDEKTCVVHDEMGLQLHVSQCKRSTKDETWHVFVVALTFLCGWAPRVSELFRDGFLLSRVLDFLFAIHGPLVFPVPMLHFDTWKPKRSRRLCAFDPPTSSEPWLLAKTRFSRTSDGRMHKTKMESPSWRPSGWLCQLSSKTTELPFSIFFSTICKPFDTPAPSNVRHLNFFFWVSWNIHLTVVSCKVFLLGKITITHAPAEPSAAEIHCHDFFPSLHAQIDFWICFETSFLLFMSLFIFNCLWLFASQSSMFVIAATKSSFIVAAASDLFLCTIDFEAWRSSTKLFNVPIVVPSVDILRLSHPWSAAPPGSLTAQSGGYDNLLTSIMLTSPSLVLLRKSSPFLYPLFLGIRLDHCLDLKVVSAFSSIFLPSALPFLLFCLLYPSVWFVSASCSSYLARFIAVLIHYASHAAS